MPVMMPAPGASSSYMPSAASGEQLEERAARIEQTVDPVAGQQLAAGDVPFPRTLIAAQRGGREFRIQFTNQPAVLLGERRRSRHG